MMASASGAAKSSQVVNEWEEWSERLLGTVKTRAAKEYSLMRLVEHSVSEKALEGDNYADLLGGCRCGDGGSE